MWGFNQSPRLHGHRQDMLPYAAYATATEPATLTKSMLSDCFLELFLARQRGEDFLSPGSWLPGSCPQLSTKRILSDGFLEFFLADPGLWTLPTTLTKSILSDCLLELFLALQRVECFPSPGSWLPDACPQRSRTVYAMTSSSDIHIDPVSMWE